MCSNVLPLYKILPMKWLSKKKLAIASAFLVLFFITNIYLSYKCFLHNQFFEQTILLQVTVSAALYLISAITLIQYFFFKENTYLYYVLYILVNVMYFTTMSSFESKENIFLPYWFNKIRFYLPLILLITSYYLYTVFAINFLSIKARDAISYKWLTYFTKTYLVLLAIALLANFFAPSPTLSILRAIILIICMPIGLISIVLVFIRVKNNITRILCIGSLFFLLGSILGFLYAAKVIPFIADRFPFNKWLFYTEAGTIIEIIMFSSSFAYRNKLLADEEKAAQQKLQLIRDEIARDLHDDIGASLSNINILNELAKRNANNPLKANEYLTKATEDIQQVSESLSDIVWNINPKYDDLSNLFIRMKRYAADMLDGKNIQHDIDFPLNITDVKLSMDKRKDLYFIYKEAINNLVKYSEANYASITLAIHNNKLQLDIKDNGIGFEKNNIIQGNGLQNMQQRAQNINADFSINSIKGSGTNITLKMQLT
jgi:signal transduction histidine kinase